MKLLLLFGDAAAGKMTVGQELMKITSLRLFHNHMTIEPVIEIFGKYDSRITQELREVVFRNFAKSDCYGMIFTFMWAFNMQEDWDFIAHILEIFNLPEQDVYYVELIAPQEVRLARNGTDNRLQHKASKRDLAASNARLLRDSTRYRCVSEPGEIPFPNYLRLENADLPAAEAAKIIKDRFALE